MVLYAPFPFIWYATQQLSVKKILVGQIYPTELQLNKANSSDTEAPFLDLKLSVTNGIASSKIYDKQDDFSFEIVNFPFLDGDFPLSPSYGVYISQLIRFARVCSNVDDFNNRNLFLTAKVLKQGYRYHKIRKAFSKFYHRHSEIIVKYNIGLKTLLQQGIPEPIFYGDLVYKFKRIVGKPNFSDQFKKIIKRYILNKTSKLPLDIFSYILTYMIHTRLKFTLNM